MNRNFAANVGTDSASIPGADPLLSDRETADQLGCGRSTVWRWASDGTLPRPIKIGGLARWRQSWITTVIQEAEADRAA
ncbi:MAG: helix-turn-helix transcriptional regulator [Cohaesibacteraceae bacterium]